MCFNGFDIDLKMGILPLTLEHQWEEEKGSLSPRGRLLSTLGCSRGLTGTTAHSTPGLWHTRATQGWEQSQPPLGSTAQEWHLLSPEPQPQTLWKALDSHPSSSSDWAVELGPRSPSSRRANPEFTKLNPSSISKQPLSFMRPKQQWSGFNDLISLPNNLELQDNFLFSIPLASLKRTSEPNGPAYQEILMHLNKKAIKHFNKVRGVQEGNN